MKVYLTYQFKDADPEQVKKKIQEFSKVIEDSTGWKTFAFFRDVQKWQKGTMSIQEVVTKAMESIKECDAIIAESSEKSNGVYFEVGYAKALGKKVIVVHKKGTEANFLEASADLKIEYEDFKELGERLRDLKTSL